MCPLCNKLILAPRLLAVKGVPGFGLVFRLHCGGGEYRICDLDVVARFRTVKETMEKRHLCLDLSACTIGEWVGSVLPSCFCPAIRGILFSRFAPWGGERFGARFSVGWVFWILFFWVFSFLFPLLTEPHELSQLCCLYV